MKTLNLRKNNQITLPREVIPEGTTQFLCERTPEGSILLKPLVPVPASEAWIYQNPERIASIKRGLEQAAKGQRKSLGSFAKYLEEDEV